MDTGSLALIDGWPLAVSDDPESTRIRDIDLAEKLGYEHPRRIRELITNLIKAGKLKDVRMVTAAVRYELRPGVFRSQAVEEYWLTLSQALKVCTRGHTDVEDKVTDAMIAVFTRVPQIMA